jgi:hypothetical protein
VVVSLTLVFVFSTAESTAITTLPNEQVGAIYVPQTPTPIPPTPTAAARVTASPDVSGNPITPTTWNAGIGAILAANCSSCHGTASGLNLQTYAAAMKGGNSGVDILPGNPDNSRLVLNLKDARHPGKLSAAELEAVSAWIRAGASEK